VRIAAAILLGSAAIDWPTLWLDRAGVALLGLAAIALALPAAPRRRARIIEAPRGPAIFDELDELEPEATSVVERILASTANGRPPA